MESYESLQKQATSLRNELKTFLPGVKVELSGARVIIETKDPDRNYYWSVHELAGIVNRLDKLIEIEDAIEETVQNCCGQKDL